MLKETYLVHNNRLSETWKLVLPVLQTGFFGLYNTRSLSSLDPVPSPPLPPLTPLPLVGPLNPARGLGSAVSSLSGVWAERQPNFGFWCILALKSDIWWQQF